MFRVIHGSFLVVAFLGVCVYHPRWAIAQVAPTNSATITGSVRTNSGVPVVGAKVSISGPRNATTQTDANGLFFVVGAPFGTYQISVTAAGLGTASQRVVVQDDINVAIQFSAGPKTIAHVSTTAQFNVTSASITHVDPLADALNGQTNWRHILEAIPGISITAGNGETVFGNVPGNPIFNLQISIDGALPYETATLFDDMPLIGNSVTSSPGTGTNLGVYPLNGFGAADVVRGPGANAPSIVDSIGGSFVLHPPGLVTQDHDALSFTRDPYGGIDFTGLEAAHFGNLSVTATYGFENSPGPSGPPTLNANWQPYLVDGMRFLGSGVRYVDPRGYQAFGYTGWSTHLLTCCYSQHYGWSQHSGSLALNYAITSRVAAEVYYSGQEEGVPFYLPIIATNFMPPAGYTGSVPAGEMNLSPGNYGYSNGNSNLFFQTVALFEEKVTAQIGDGVLRAALLQNTTSNGYQSAGYPGPAVGQLYGGGLLCSNTSPNCRTGHYSPVVFNGGTYNLVSPSIKASSNYSTHNRDLLLSYAIAPSDYTQAGISFVQSFYNEPFAGVLHYVVNPSFTINSNSRSFLSDTQETKEMRIFFGAEPTSRTTVDLSWYLVGSDYHLQNTHKPGVYTDSTYAYSAPRLGFEWQPSAKIAVRAALGGGFAQAPLGDLLGSPDGIPFCSHGICTLSVTNPNLQPEKSFAFDLGTDVRLGDDTIASFDVYRANLFGQVNRFTSLDGLYTGLPLYVSTYGNLAHSRYEGVLLDLRNAVSHGLTWSFAAGLTRGYLVSVPAGFYNGTKGFPPHPCTNCANEGILTNINFDAAFSGVVPYAQGHATIGYQWKPSEFVTLLGTYYGNNNSYLRRAFTEWDAVASYPVTKYGALLLTFTNLTGVYDQPVGIIDAGSITGVPAIPGVEPFAYFNGVYGPRTVTLTLQVHR